MNSKVMFFAGKWMKLGEITLGELSQPQKKNTIFLSCVFLDLTDTQNHIHICHESRNRAD